ncbi:MAG TPA: GntR family transcriptional regulator [Chthonomonas sp.]|uniref:GntR family transcriptional regulator n=1 Tax=Chthonomonas sp. TaxID=2282153 RepID=UPI002B4B71AB|nr:GntR family transcriptional regulator [Chthonomonas sp.]HLH79763.1 GntR family transcriptional regulator [Chthonomonas sp.]
MARKRTLSPSAQHIADTLENRIRAGVYLAGQWLPAEREIAQEFGVSRIVVRAAIHELEKRRLLVRSAKCRPIVQTPVATTPSLSNAATRRFNIGLWLWPTPGDPAYAMIVRGIRKSLDEAHFRLITETPVESDWPSIRRAERLFLQRMREDRDIAGIILWYLGGTENIAALQQVREAGIPMVFIDRRPPEGFDADYVGVDNIHAAENIVRHLLSRGHRVIAHISNLDTASTVEERHQGYRRALELAGIPYRPELVCRDPGSPEDNPSEGLLPLIRSLLQRPDPPTAFFAVNDLVAQRTHSALRKLGVCVPDDVALAGFDGTERWSPHGCTLTTANQPFESMGTRAVEVLLRRMKVGSDGTWQHVLLEAPIAIYQSTSTVPTKRRFNIPSDKERSK